jgi:hypothetical protein
MEHWDPGDEFKTELQYIPFWPSESEAVTSGKDVL